MGCIRLKKKKILVHQQGAVLKLANVMTNPCLMWPHYISYVIKLRTQLLQSLRLLGLDKCVAYTGGGGVLLKPSFSNLFHQLIPPRSQ